MRSPKTTRHKNITRIDHPDKHTFGYNVRIMWRGKRYCKFFSDGIYGDRLAALDAAIEWRNQREQEIGKPRTEQLVVGWHSRNNTGIVGVRRRKRGFGEVFEATWVVRDENNDRRRITTCFSIGRHGEKKAFRMALRARQRGEQRRWGVPRVRRSTSELSYQPWRGPI